MLAIYFAVGALAAACKTDGTAKNNCVADQCDMVGETEICMQCQSSNIPINGKCIAESGGANADKCKTPTSGKCSACGAGYFLHKGGCYAIGGDPGSFICADEASGSGGTEGVCSTCKTANGFFKHPSPAATKQSCISCSETNNVDSVTGVAGCTACNPPSEAGDNTTPKAAICTACTDPKIVKTAAGATSCIDESACNNGFFVETTASGSTSSKVCTACTDDNCDVCAASGAKKCNKCKTSGDKIYLQKEADSQTGTCVTASVCTTDNTYYPDDTAKTCKSCAEGVPNCKTCTKESSGTVTCSACLEGFFAESKSTCTACADSNCAVCTAAGTGKCSKCRDGYTLDSQANTCASSSANRSSLSTGAIAGISVAAVVVVGGLVGFLCWWFVCRGKA
ncbi:Variant-specific surface protein [Giardia duodenalis]|uniref:Variant-specific surface protein n=1 Tax=Giardia intestinalis TaxID=5741 RepID=V6TPX7_GIAIN|nr:Variant-specific surface protein [Giardia intestinalis]